MASGGPSVLGWSAEDAGLLRAVRNLKGQFQSGNQAMKRVNQASVKYLVDASVDILDNKANRRERDERNRVGLRVVEQEDAHIANQDTFAFWVFSQVDGIDARVNSYFRAIDRGSSYWVDRTEGGNDWVSLFFVGEPTGPVRGGGRQAAFAGPGGARVRITRPVPKYAFLSDPVQRFHDDGIYAKLVAAEFNAIGLKPVYVKGP